MNDHTQWPPGADYEIKAANLLKIARAIAPKIYESDLSDSAMKKILDKMMADKALR